MSSINGQNIERMRVNGNEIALAKINGNVVFQKKKLIKTFYGDSKQETTTGKNLLPFPYSANEKNQNGINFKVNNDGSITINGTSTGNAYFALLGYGDTLGQVKIEGNYISGGSEDAIINVNYFDETYHTLATNNNGSTEIDKSVYDEGYIEIYIPPNKTFNNYIIKPILSYEIVDSWEPYTGGKPSPSPDYPQKISSINGVNLKLVGKNLYNNEYTNNIISNEGIITSNPNWNMSDYIEVESNKSYTFSHNDNNSTGQSLMIIEFDENKNFIKRNSQGNYNYEIYEPYTITTNSSTKFLVLNYNNTYNNNLFQLEKGPQATTYEPYKTQTISVNLQENILAKVGDYADELQLYSNGDVKLVKKINKTILNNNSNYEKSIMSNDNYFKGYLSGWGLNEIYLDYVKIMNTHFQSGMYTETSEQETMANRNQLHIQILASRLSENSADGLREWLGNNNVAVLRPLVNSTTTKVDNIKSELNSFGDYSNIEIESTYS